MYSQHAELKRIFLINGLLHTATCNVIYLRLVYNQPFTNLRVEGGGGYHIPPLKSFLTYLKRSHDEIAVNRPILPSYHPPPSRQTKQNQLLDSSRKTSWFHVL